MGSRRIVKVRIPDEEPDFDDEPSSRAVFLTFASVVNIPIVVSFLGTAISILAGQKLQLSVGEVIYLVVFIALSILIWGTAGLIGYGITAEYEVENGPGRWCLAGLIAGVSIPILLNGLFILGIIVWAMLGMKGEGLFFIAIMLQGTWVIFPLVGAIVGVISGIVLKYLK